MIEPLLPAARHGGRPRTVNLRLVVNTIFYLNKAGCQWDRLPKDLAKRSTANGYCNAWKADGTWQIGDDGTIILGVQSSPKGRGAHYRAHEAIRPDRFRQWLHLAVVYDKGAGRVTHYLDGRPVAEEWVEFEIPLRVAEAELGSWNLASHRNRTPVRFFSGCIDEFVIFSRPLGGGEVERLYTQGRPPS